MSNYLDLAFKTVKDKEINPLILLYNLPYNINLRTTLILNLSKQKYSTLDSTICFDVPHNFDFLFKITSINSENIQNIEFTRLGKKIEVGEEFILALFNNYFSTRESIKIFFDSKENIPDNIFIELEVGLLKTHIRDRLT